MLKRRLAPITDDAWEEIDGRAKEVLSKFLSGRKVVNVNGPKGWNYTVVPEGRLEEVEEKDDLYYSLYKVKPLVETRVEFELDRWELDNLVRGAKDIQLDNLEEAAKKIALNEENAIYNGLEKGLIKGLKNSTEQDVINFGRSGEEILESVTEGMLNLKKAYSEGPYALVVGKEAYKRINVSATGYPLVDRLKKLLGMEVIFSHVVDGAFLIPYNNDDLEMTIGNDLSIGYQDNDNKKIKFFITESFTFRVLDPNIIIPFKI